MIIVHTTRTKEGMLGNLRLTKLGLRLINLVLVTTFGLLSAQLEVLGPLQRQMLLRLTFLALQTKHNLPRGLGLLVEDGLGLSSKTHLLRIVTTLSLGEVGRLSGLVLGHLVGLVLAALLTRAVGFAFFGDVDHFGCWLFRGDAIVKLRVRSA